MRSLIENLAKHNIDYDVDNDTYFMIAQLMLQNSKSQKKKGNHNSYKSRRAEAKIFSEMIFREVNLCYDGQILPCKGMIY